MSYDDYIERENTQTLNASVATKIRDLMKDLRLSCSEESPRRWVWELLQNAKDVSESGRKVKIRISLDDSKLKFSHNGGAFTTKNIISLINQVSSKEQDSRSDQKERETGKFGTGFLTTHLLSEVVDVAGILKEADQPYKKFNIRLDRTGRDIETIIKSVENSREQLKHLQTHDNYSCEDFNTTFTYSLSKDGIDIAERGIEDLKYLIIFTLIFSPQIESVDIRSNNELFYLQKDKEIIKNNIQKYTIIKKKEGLEKKREVVVISQDDISIACEIQERDGKISLKEIGELTPRIFCVFPLIGTEKFSFPFIINCPRLNPTEPRNGVYLTDKEDELINENKEIMGTAVKLYSELIEFAAINRWGNMYLFAENINSNPDEKWLSSDWLNEHIVSPVKNRFLDTPIVDTLDGSRKSIRRDKSFQIMFPSHKDYEVRASIYNLYAKLFPGALPIQADMDKWDRVLDSRWKLLKLGKLAKMIQEYKNLECLQGELKETNAINWLNQYYKLLNDEKIFIEQINGDKYAVIPNQNGSFTLHTKLFIDQEIEEVIKDILKELGEDYREILIHRQVGTGEGIKYHTKSTDDIINRINYWLGNCNEALGLQVSLKLVSLMPGEDAACNQREIIYDLCNTIFYQEVSDKNKIKNWKLDLWEKSDAILVKELVKKVSSYKGIDNLMKELGITDEKEMLQWIDRLISYLEENQYQGLTNDENNPILPNQDGTFCSKDKLVLDDGSIGRELKDISYKLGYNFREELLKKEIFLKLPAERTRTIKDVAEKITFLVRGKWNELLKTAETKQALKELLLWFNENEDRGKKFFGDLYKYKHRCLDDDELVESIDKAKKYDEIVNALGAVDCQRLEQALKSIDETGGMGGIEKEMISEETLIQLGIDSPEGLEYALANKVFKENFIHKSDKDMYKFEYVQNIIKRSIDNVLSYLENDLGYDLQDREPIAATIFPATNSNKEEIYLIIRPADADQIIFYYDSEMDILDYEKNWEIWVDKEGETPQKITFGKILKITGINRIPLKSLKR